MSRCLPVSLMPNTNFLFRLFFASICCYIIRIAMCPSTYLSHSYTQCLPYMSVSLSPSPSPSVFTSLCRYIMCTIVFVCLSHSCHYTCFHINRSYQLTELCRQSSRMSVFLLVHLVVYSFSVYSNPRVTLALRLAKAGPKRRGPSSAGSGRCGR